MSDPYREIQDALENSASRRKTGNFDPVTPDKRDILNHRDLIMRFLEDIDGGYTVSDLRDAMEDYR